MQIDAFTSLLSNVKPKGAGYMARCPGHDDDDNSLSIDEGDDGRILLKCFAGCAAEDIVTAVGLDMADLFGKEKGARFTPPSTSAQVHQSAKTKDTPYLSVISRGVTIEQYAEAKALPADFLRDQGLSDTKRNKQPAIRIPYTGANGEVLAVRYRINVKGDCFRWKDKAKTHLYGIWRLNEARRAGHVTIVEGESDCHTAWFHSIPAIGVPGASNWNEERDAPHFEGIENIYVVIEPDDGGDAVQKWVATSAIKDRVNIVSLGEHKDISGLHLANPKAFDREWQEALKYSIPFAEVETKAAEAERKAATEACAGLVSEPDILAKFASELEGAGVVGEAKTTKLIYLALTSRFSSRPISLVIKGPSSAGKSFTIEKTLSFFPEDAYYSLTATPGRCRLPPGPGWAP